MARWAVELTVIVNEIEANSRMTPQGPMTEPVLRSKTTFACGGENSGDSPVGALSEAMDKLGNFLHKLRTPNMNQKES